MIDLKYHYHASKMIDWLIDWLVDSLIDWLVEGLIDWLIDWMSELLRDCELSLASTRIKSVVGANKLISGAIMTIACTSGGDLFISIHWLIDWLIDRRIDCSIQHEQPYLFLDMLKANLFSVIAFNLFSCIGILIGTNMFSYTGQS